MKFLKDNPFLAGIIAAAVVVLGGLGFLLSQSMAEYGMQKENLESRISELHRLQNASPYPSTENLEATKASTTELKSSLVALETQIRTALPEVPSDVTPQQFQDNLRTAVSAVVEKAAEEKVGLPEDFYLGFDGFRANLPAPNQAPLLARQLEVNSWLVNTLIESGVARIDALIRNPLPVEASQTPASTEPTMEIPAPGDILIPNSIVLTITGDQARIRRALNDLMKSPQFMIVRALEMVNSAQEGPLKGSPVVEGTMEQPASVESLFQESTPTAQPAAQDLPIILGKETVTAKLHLQFFDIAPLNLQ